MTADIEVKMASDKQVIARQQEKITRLEAQLMKIANAGLILRLAKEMRLQMAATILAGMTAANSGGTYNYRAQKALEAVDALIEEASR